MGGAADGIWRTILDDLRSQIVDGRFAPGAPLPTQAALCRQYRAQRHSVRRAIRALTDEQLVVSWQGKGAIVLPNRVAYPINDRTRFSDNVRRGGHLGETRMLGTRRRVPTAAVSRLLGVTAREIVVVAELLRVVDGVPTILARHHYDARRFPTIADDIERTASVTRALATLGVADYRRDRTLVETRLPSAHEATILDIAPAQPVLVVTGRNVDRLGLPIEVSEAVSRGDRVQLVI